MDRLGVGGFSRCLPAMVTFYGSPTLLAALSSVIGVLEMGGRDELLGIPGS